MPFSVSWSVSTLNPCLKSTMNASTMMQVTDSPSMTRVSSDGTRMSLKAMYQQTAALTRKRRIGATVTCMPIAVMNCCAKTANPARPATPMKRYDQIRVQPDSPMSARAPAPCTRTWIRERRIGGRTD